MQLSTRKTTKLRCLALLSAVAIAGVWTVRITPASAAAPVAGAPAANPQDFPEDAHAPEDPLGRIDFQLHNHSGKTVMYIYVRKHGTTGWGDDLLGDDTVDDGDDYTVRPPEHEGDGNMFDLKLMMDGNETHYWSNLNLDQLSDMTLNFDDQHKAHLKAQ